jgi:hypothetical protein
MTGIKVAMVYSKVKPDQKMVIAAQIIPDISGIKSIMPNRTSYPISIITSVIRQQIDKVNQANARHKKIEEFQIVKEIPRTSNGKLKRIFE